MKTALDLLSFIEASPTPFHCVAEAATRLKAAGFSPVTETGTFGHEPGAARYCVRGDGSLIAWRGGAVAPAEGGFRLVGAHTDSPNLRLKPRPARAKEGYLLYDVDVYGGVLLATWTDRDLGLAGRIVVDVEGRLESRLIRLDAPRARVTNLAIHLNREVNDKGLVLNKHQHLAPLLGLWPEGASGTPRDVVIAALATAAGVRPEQVRGHDLCLYDTLPPALGGVDDAFLFAPRLDNQAMCHAALTALIDTPPGRATAVIALFDHEEVGSGTARGADGPFLGDVMLRLAGGDEPRCRAVARSHLISADMAHAVHPHHAEQHDREHMPRLNAGPVIKTNDNQRYATDGTTAALFRSLCADLGVPCQEFVNRPDLACGTTIGPISASRLGVPTVDVGNPMLSMHSIREMAGSRDPALMTAVMTAFLGGAR
ncbi:M18 family aminopeptidase [Myxococcota bacterium]|nr:M18 family aminopeptidase [Myxococcota bacterium]